MLSMLNYDVVFWYLTIFNRLRFVLQLNGNLGSKSLENLQFSDTYAVKTFFSRS